LIREPKDGYRAVYCQALGRIGPDAEEAVGLLENCLTNENRGIRLVAADALTKIAPQQCSNAVAVLKRLQHDPDLATVWVVDTNGIVRRTEQKDFDSPTCRFFRLSASVALWRLGLEKDPPVISIVEQLEKQAGSDELAYVELLGEIGHEAKPALPLLTSMPNPDRFIGLRRAAAIAIRKIDPAEAAKLGLPGTLAIP
jgi:HEAT repeat protein